MKNNCGILVLFFNLILLSKSGLAQLRFYNACSQRVEVAVKYLGRYNNSSWSTKGWFKIEPGGYATILTDPIYNRYIYFYANTEDSRYVWSGNTPVCVSYKTFNYFEGFANQECPDVLQFKLIDTGGETNYTQPLTCEGQDDYPVNERTTWTIVDVENMALADGRSVAACGNIKGNNVLTLESIHIRDNGEHSWRDPAALGIEILLSDDLVNWYQANSLPLIGLHYEGPEEKGNCQGYAKLEWYDNESIRYLNYGIFNWNTYRDYKYIRFRITEGDHEYDPNWAIPRNAVKYSPLRWVPGVRSTFVNDIVFDVYDKTENLKDGNVIKLESNNIKNGATMWVQTKSNY